MRDKQQGKIRSIDRTIFEWSPNKLIVEVAKEPEEVRTLLEARFGYMCQKEIRGFLRNANELEHQKVVRAGRRKRGRGDVFTLGRGCLQPSFFVSFVDAFVYRTIL